MFTKTQYQVISATLKAQRFNIAPDSPIVWAQGYNDAINRTAHNLAATFAADNPRFDMAKFLEACGVK